MLRHRISKLYLKQAIIHIDFEELSSIHSILF